MGVPAISVVPEARRPLSEFNCQKLANLMLGENLRQTSFFESGTPFRSFKYQRATFSK
jgi:hypothetical protein